MSRFRSKSARRWAARLAIMGLLFQAALSSWHAAAMFGFAAGRSDGNVQAAMMCHKATGATTDEQNGSKPAATQNCSCCLGVILVATAFAVAIDVQPAPTVEVGILASSSGLAAGRHLLAPESRAPPHIV